jgi:hypothetical protein
MLNRCARVALVIVMMAVFGIISLAFIVPRTELAVEQQDSGDFAVWIVLHELLARGHLLYRDVWDHKDPGFYLIPHFFFSLLGVRGLYWFGLLATSLFGVGIALLIRSLVGWLAGVGIAAGATMYYASWTPFWATYTENYSLGFLALGLGLVMEFPALAGFVLALACTIKFGVVVVCMTLFFLGLARGICLSVSLSALWRLLLGFLVGLIIFFLFYWNELDPRDWLEVIIFNREYAQRRSSPFQWGDLTDVMVSAPSAIQWLLGVCTASTLVGLGLKKIPGCRVPRGELFTPLQIAAAALFGGIVLMVLQHPPAIQHWLFLWGATLYAACVAVCFCISRLPWRVVRFVALTGLCIPVLLYYQTGLQFVRGFSVQSAYSFADSKANLREYIKNLPENTTFAIIGGNDNRLDFAEAPRNIRLACRFFFQFEIFSPRFDKDIDSCVDKKPMFFFLNNNHRRLNVLEQIERLKREYVICAQPPGVYTIYGSSKEVCDHIRG